MNIEVERVLALSPHPDDVELGAGGTVTRLVESGAEVVLAVFSSCQESVPDHEALAREARCSAQHLGIKNVRHCLYPVRRFDEHRQGVLQALVQLREQYDPQLVIGPSTYDEHQDHVVVAAEMPRAFRGVTLLGYESAGGSRVFSADLLVRLTQGHVERKLAALACFETQRNRPYFAPDHIRGWARVRGTHARAQYAEAFEVIRAVV